VEIDFWPRSLISKLPISEPSRTHLSILLSSVTAIAATPLLVHIPHTCLARLLLGIRCPGCGITHAILAAEHFNFAAAWKSNPAGLGVLAIFSYQVVFRPVALIVPFSGEKVAKMSQILSGAVLLWMLCVWIWRLI